MRQHTVPRCYLQHFTDSEGFVWVLDIDNKVFKVKPENILKENHFYTVTLKTGEKSFVVENTLSNIENAYANIYENKIMKNLYLTQEEKAEVSVFISAMIHRTKPNREGMKNMFEDLKVTMEKWKKQSETLTAEEKRTSHATPSGKGASISLKELTEGLENFDEQHSMTLLNQFASSAQYIFNMKWSIMTPENKVDRFVTSDDPVAMKRPASIKKYGANAMGSRAGLAYQDVELTIPLSKDQFLLAGWILNQDSYMSIPSEMVNIFNQRTILSSSERVIASSKKEVEEILKKYPSNKKR
jgi:hypothetical protein